MYVTEEDDSEYRVQYRSYRLAVVLLLLPPLVLIELGPGLVGGDTGTSELRALILGLLFFKNGTLDPGTLRGWHFACRFSAHWCICGHRRPGGNRDYGTRYRTTDRSGRARHPDPA